MRFLILGAVLAAQTAASSSYVPPRAQSTRPPLVPVRTVGAGEVFLEVSIARDGSVTAITPLRSNEPFTQALTDAARVWRFTPAMALPPGVPAVDAAGKPAKLVPVESTALIAGEFLAPTLNVPTLGEASKDTAASSAPKTPIPIATVAPVYPPSSLSGGVVLVEVRIAPSGDVLDAQVIVPSPSFDQPALNAARQWKFRPMRGLDATPYAYIAFGFRQPVTGG